MVKRNGVTLIEISIVLTIIALLMGLVLVSGDLYKQSNIRKFIADIGLYKEKILSFRDQYGYLPGDFPSATNFWTGATNGDGNRIVISPENFHAWNHLYLAGYVEVAYNYSNYSANFGLYAPPTSLGNLSFFNFITLDTPSSNGISTLYSLYGSQGHLLTSYTLSASNSISPIMAYSIDQKIDDGDPSRGKIIAYPNLNNNSGTCISGNTSAPGSGAYILNDSTTMSCAVAIWVEKKVSNSG